MADTASTSEGTLEQQLEEMLQIEKFEPPEEFRQHALLNDPSIYEEADGDWKGWWVKQAKNLHWFKEPTTDVDESNASTTHADNASVDVISGASRNSTLFALGNPT